MKSRNRLVPLSAIVSVSAFFFFLFFSNCRQTGNEEVSYEDGLLSQARVFFRPMPEHAFEPGKEASPELIELGKMLYFEPRLSRSGLISCHTCHNFSLSGVDNLPVSIGHGWQKGVRNSPTVLNAALHSLQFHDGREPDVEAQALQPILNEVEMAATEEHAVAVLSSIPEYRKLFGICFPGEEEPLTFKNIGVAIGAFERILLTYSRFDKFINGDTRALTPNELSGLETFVDKGCIACHVTETLGGQTFAKFITPRELSGETDPDPGRFDATGLEQDRHFFKVPSLLNVAETFPYFHDGSEMSLAVAIREIGKSQLGLELSDEEIDRLVSFMHSLSGEAPLYAREIPLLPPSTADTPIPRFD